MTLDEVVAETQQKAREIARSAEHAPLVMLITGGEVVPTLMRGPPRDILPQVLATTQPDAYVLVIEGRFRAGGHPPAYDGEIADNPDNSECLVMIACARGGPARSWMANIWPATERAARRRGEREIGVWQDPETAGLGFAGGLVIENWEDTHGSR